MTWSLRPDAPERHNVATRRTLIPLVLLTCGVLAGESAAQVPVRIGWDPPDDGVTAGYQVFVGTSSNSLLVELDVGPATSVTLPLPTGADYYVTVRGYTSQRITGPTAHEIEVDLASTPGAPAELLAFVNGSTATLVWAPPGARGRPASYFVSVGTAPGLSNLLDHHPVGNVLSIGGEVPQGRYFARVHAGNHAGVGPPSAEVVFAVGEQVLDTPAAPTGLTFAWQGNEVRLSWTQSPGAVVSSYVLEAGSAPGLGDVAVLDVGNVTSLTATVPPGRFFVRVRAINAAGASSASNEVVLIQTRAPVGPPH